MMCIVPIWGFFTLLAVCIMIGCVLRTLLPVELSIMIRCVLRALWPVELSIMIRCVLRALWPVELFICEYVVFYLYRINL